MFTHFSPKTTIFALLRGHFWPKTWKIKCFQFIQSKISQFGTQMWLPKKLQFLVPGTPPEPPIPPLTPPRGPGGPKMAKMHSLKSNNDNQCQKSHFRGVKNFDLFFHLECPVSDISIYICLIDIRCKSKEQLNERRAGMSRSSSCPD